jgi:dipeptidyl aminopeptidase/acylaminoacyl peptidase
MRRLFLASALLAVSLPAGPRPAASETHPFSVHDMIAMDRIGDPQVSPGGRTVLFSMSSLDLEHNRRQSSLWSVGMDGTGLRRLTAAGSAGNARWSPDGASIWFLSSRSGSSQVWRLPVAGGEAEQVTRLPLDVNALVVSPDGKRLAIAMSVFPGTTPAETRQRLDATEAKEKEGPSGRLYDSLFVRHWDEWADGTRSHLFVLTLGGGEPVDVMKDMVADAPSKPFGGPEEATFSPDGATLVFAARDVGRAEPWSTDFDLFAVPVDGSAPPRDLTRDNPAWDTAPAFSPDGKTLAYLAMKEPGYEADRFRIVLRAWPDGPTRVLTEGWDRSVGSLAWTGSGKDLVVTAEDHGQNALWAVDMRGGVRRLVGTGTVEGVAVGGGRLVYGLNTLSGPTELHLVDLEGTESRALTHVNDERMASTRIGAYEQFHFIGAGGDTVFGYVVKPIDFDPARTYPVAFLIHGGPQGSFGNQFHYRWNPQAYAARGYAAVMVDFHGSTGYGQRFCDAIQGDWGGKPLVDLQKGLAAALARNPWMDGTRVAAVGASYGAYMVNWIAGNWPDRFRCLVSHDGNLDERMAYFDTEELWFPERDHKGTPWTNPRAYEDQNPVNFVKRWKTPMLVVHGGRDFRIPYQQGIATFTALQRLGVRSRFLYFPDENHWVLKPRNSVLWHDTVFDWLDRWTKK